MNWSIKKEFDQAKISGQCSAISSQCPSMDALGSVIDPLYCTDLRLQKSSVSLISQGVWVRPHRGGGSSWTDERQRAPLLVEDKCQEPWVKGDPHRTASPRPSQLTSVSAQGKGGFDWKRFPTYTSWQDYFETTATAVETTPK
jgi:hypothetical protein